MTSEKVSPSASAAEPAPPQAPRTRLTASSAPTEAGETMPHSWSHGAAAPIRSFIAIALLTIGCVAGAIGSAWFKLTLDEALVFSASGGVALGAVTAFITIIIPELRARADRAALVKLLHEVAHVEREQPIEALLQLPKRHQLASVAGAMHHALVSTHKHRLEAVRIRRTLDDHVEKRTRQATARLTRQAETDELTQLLNRRGLDRRLEEMFDACTKSHDNLVLIAIDLDRFKQLNDIHGHGKGDEALRAAGELLRAQLRDGDIAARIGGDELIVALQPCDVQAGLAVSDRLMRLFRVHPAGIPVGSDWPSMSAGLASVQDDRPETAKHLMEMADEALYASKKAGRGRCLARCELKRPNSSQAA